MNFNDLVTEIRGITARPDKTTEIVHALNSVLSLCSIKANFAKDLVETSIPISPTLYGDTIQFDDPALPYVSRFRKFKYVKPAGEKRYLMPIGADKLFTPENVVQLDRYYIAGNNFTYTLSKLNTSLEVGYFQYPPVFAETNTTSYWMFDLMPAALVDLACARIFRSIGDDASSRMHQESGEAIYKAARRDFEDSISIGAM